MSEKLLRLRYPATCSSCGGALAKGTEASWNRETKTATCGICLGAPDVATAAAAEAIERGEAGGSAAREWRRRHDRREQTVRSRYGRLSGVVLALSDDPHSTAAWAYGSWDAKTAVFVCKTGNQVESASGSWLDQAACKPETAERFSDRGPRPARRRIDG